MSASASIGRKLNTVKATAIARFSENLLERELLPDILIRPGIRHLLKQRLQEENLGDVERQKAHLLLSIT